MDLLDTIEYCLAKAQHTQGSHYRRLDALFSPARLEKLNRELSRCSEEFQKYVISTINRTLEIGELKWG